MMRPDRQKDDLRVVWLCHKKEKNTQRKAIYPGPRPNEGLTENKTSISTIPIFILGSWSSSFLLFYFSPFFIGLLIRARNKQLNLHFRFTEGKKVF